jgi:hypothetical protein
MVLLPRVYVAGNSHNSSMTEEDVDKEEEESLNYCRDALKRRCEIEET